MWGRLQALPLYNIPSYNLGEGKFTFSQLGYDGIPLFNHPKLEKNEIDKCIARAGIGQEEEKEAGRGGALGELSVAGPINRLALHNSLDQYYFGSNYYDGDDDNHNKSLQIIVDGIVKEIDDIIVCDLSGWIHRPPPGKVVWILS